MEVEPTTDTESVADSSDGAPSPSDTPASDTDATPSAPADRLDYIADTVAQLYDLFRRRLLDDRQKARAFDELYVQLEQSRRIEEGVVLLGFAQEIALVLDRIERYEGTDGEFAASVHDELLGILRHHGIERVQVDDGFDARLHEAVDTIQVDGLSAPVSTVASVRRHGYHYFGRLIRPAQVVVSCASNASAAPPSEQKPQMDSGAEPVVEPPSGVGSIE